jgi:hypothetical protein
MSLFLNGVQIIEKREWDSTANATGGFEPTEGFDGSTFETPLATADTTEVDEDNMDEIPF